MSVLLVFMASCCVENFFKTQTTLSIVNVKEFEGKTLPQNSKKYPSKISVPGEFQDVSSLKV